MSQEGKPLRFAS